MHAVARTLGRLVCVGWAVSHIYHSLGLRSRAAMLQKNSDLDFCMQMARMEVGTSPTARQSCR